MFLQTLISMLAVALCFLASASPSGADGPMFSAPSVIDPEAAGDVGHDNVPSLVGDGRGTWIAAWHSTDPRGDRIGRDPDILFSVSRDGRTWSPVQPLNTNAVTDTGVDLAPSLATDRRGHWVAVWESTEDLAGVLGRDRDILSARSLDDGATWSRPEPVGSQGRHDWGDDSKPQLATDGNGAWVAVWQSTDTLLNTLGGDTDLLFSVSHDDGLTWTTAAALNRNAQADDRFDTSPRIATDRAGTWLVSWASGGPAHGRLGYERDIVYARSDDAGATWTPPTALASDKGADTRPAWGPAMAGDGKGNWVGVWASSDSLGGTIGLDRDVFIATSADAGHTWSAPRALNRNAAEDAGDDSSPNISTDGSGTWVTVWQSWEGLAKTIDADADLFVAVSHDQGATWSRSLVLNSNAAEDYGEDVGAQLANDNKGNWLVVWESNEPAVDKYGTDSDVFFARAQLRPLQGPPTRAGLLPGTSGDDGSGTRRGGLKVLLGTD